jgi:hypothetical protein
MLTKLKDYMFAKVETTRFDMWLYHSVVYLGAIAIALKYLLEP